MANRRAFPELPQAVQTEPGHLRMLVDLLIRAVNILRDEALPDVMRVASSITIDKRHRIVIVDTASAARTITLPKGLGDGFVVLLKDSGNAGSNNITVAGDTGVTVEGAASITISTNSDYRRLMYDADNANWMRVG